MIITTHPGMLVCSRARAQELLTSEREAIGAVVSIADPDSNHRPKRNVLESYPLGFLELDFHDIEHERDDYAPPTRAHVEKLLYQGGLLFAACRFSETRLLVHCYAGRSRSTAAALALLAQFDKSRRHVDGRWVRSSLDAKAAMTELLQACERAPLPNMLVIQHADELLGYRGALVKVAQDQNDSPEDAVAEAGVAVTGTAFLVAAKKERT